MSSELLPKVDVYRLSEAALQQLQPLINAAVRAALEEQGLKKPRVTPGALRGKDAADYLGISRSRFYALLKTDPALKAASFTVGKSRAWTIAALDEWMRLNQKSLGNACQGLGKEQP
jgi:predicted DNA-binding transcriptional regulator AlpA